MDSTYTLLKSIFSLSYLLVYVIGFFFDCLFTRDIMVASQCRPTKKSFIPYVRYIEIATKLSKKKRISKLGLNIFKFVYYGLLPFLNACFAIYVYGKWNYIVKYLNTPNIQEPYSNDEKILIATAFSVFAFYVFNVIISKIFEWILRIKLMNYVFAEHGAIQRFLVRTFYSLMILGGRVTTIIGTFALDFLYSLQEKLRERSQY